MIVRICMIFLFALALLTSLIHSPFLASAAETTQLAVQVPISLKRDVVVQDEIVRLGDLFDGLAARDPDKAEIPIARSPDLGRRIDLNARWLAALAISYGVDWQPRSALDQSTLERASQAIRGDEIERAIKAELETRGLRQEMALLFDTPNATLYLPRSAEPSLAVAGLSFDSASGRFAAQVVAPADGPTAGTLRISGRAVEMIEVPVLTQRLEPGEVVQSRHLRWESMRSDGIARNVVTNAGAVIGKSPRRPIRAGEAIRDGDLEEPVVVSKNSLVTVRLVHARMVLTAQARALESGATGDLVRVMNTKSNQIINAVVIAAGTVEVPGSVGAVSQAN